MQKIVKTAIHKALLFKLIDYEQYAVELRILKNKLTDLRTSFHE